MKISILALLLCFSLSGYALQDKCPSQISSAIRYLYSTQLSYGEFVSLFHHELFNIEDKHTMNVDSNLFNTALIVNFLQSFKVTNPIQAKEVRKIIRQGISFIREQSNPKGLWSYFTTHNPDPLYSDTQYDMDDTVIASDALLHNKSKYANNTKAIENNVNSQGFFLTFFHPDFRNDVDTAVNANALEYTEKLDPHFSPLKICQLINNNIQHGQTGSFYYPKFSVYYFISRAYKSDIPCLAASKNTIIKNILSAQKPDGSIGGNTLDTAQAILTLLNFGYNGSTAPLLAARKYLLESQSKIDGSWPSGKFWIYSAPVPMIKSLRIVIGYSTSRALTTAVSVLALQKLNNYDYGYLHC